MDPLIRIHPLSAQSSFCYKLRMSYPRMANLVFDGGDNSKLDVKPVIYSFAEHAEARKRSHKSDPRTGTQ